MSQVLRSVRSAPRLLAIPAVWLAWATIAFIAFLLSEAWANIRDVSSATPSSIHVNVALSMLVTIELVAGLVQAAYVIPAFEGLSKPGDMVV